MPSTTTLIEDTRRVLMISVNGKVTVNPELCKHENVDVMTTGHRWYNGFDVSDDLETVVQCHDCGWVLRDDNTWGPTLKVEDEKEIPF